MTVKSMKAMDRLSVLAGVFFFGFCAYLIYDTHFVMAVVCVICAALFPYIVVAAHRARAAMLESDSTKDEVGTDSE